MTGQRIGRMKMGCTTADVLNVKNSSLVINEEQFVNHVNGIVQPIC